MIAFYLFIYLFLNLWTTIDDFLTQILIYKKFHLPSSRSRWRCKEKHQALVKWNKSMKILKPSSCLSCIASGITEQSKINWTRNESSVLVRNALIRFWIWGLRAAWLLKKVLNLLLVLSRDLQVTKMCTISSSNCLPRQSGSRQYPPRFWDGVWWLQTKISTAIIVEKLFI